jgi:PAS domain S-box-containing protein
MVSHALDAFGVWHWAYDRQQDRLTLSEGLRAQFDQIDWNRGSTRLAAWLDTIHPDDRDGIRGILTDPAGPGDALRFEFRLIDGSGRWVWFESRGRVAQRDQAGHCSISEGIVQDVSRFRRQDNFLSSQQAFNRINVEVHDVAGFSEAVLRAVLELPELDAGGFYCRDAEGGYLLVAQSGLSPGFVAYASQVPPGSERALKIEQGQRFCSCLDGGPGCPDVDMIRTSRLREEGFASLIVLPILVGGGVSACMTLVSRTVRRQTEDTVRFLEGIADQCGHALDRSIARQQADIHRRNLDELFQTMNDFVFVVDTEGRILQFNGAVRKRLGHDERIIGCSILGLHPSRTREEARAVLGEILAGERATCAVPLLDADGNEIQVDTRVVPVSWDGQPALLGISRDISALIAAREELERRERYQRAVLDNFPFMVWLKDRDGRYLAVNEPFAQGCGLSAAEIAGKTDADIWSSDLAERYRADDLDVLRTGLPKNVEEPLAGSGRDGWVETFRSPITLGGRVIGTVGFARIERGALAGDARRDRRRHPGCRQSRKRAVG